MCDNPFTFPGDLNDRDLLHWVSCTFKIVPHKELGSDIIEKLAHAHAHNFRRNSSRILWFKYHSLKEPNDTRSYEKLTDLEVYIQFPKRRTFGKLVHQLAKRFYYIISIDVRGRNVDNVNLIFYYFLINFCCNLFIHHVECPLF